MRYFYSPTHQEHDTRNVIVEGAHLVIEEVPQRAEIIRAALEQAGFGPGCAPHDHGLTPLLDVHAADYVEFLSSAYQAYGKHYQKFEPVTPGTFAPPGARRSTRHIYGRLGMYAYGIGSPILEGTWNAAYWSAQCALSAVEYVTGDATQGETVAGETVAGETVAGETVAGETVAGETVAYALCRPPGHHAARALFGGFCYLNNAAIAARALQRAWGATDGTAQTTAAAPGRVAILDVDYHHGNGTQEIFYEDGSVLFCSLHAHPDDDYPFYWGDRDETGVGDGAGCNRNWPLPQGTGDEQYLAALEQALVCVSEFQPRGLVVSLGLDTFQGDPVGGFALSTAGIGAVGAKIAALAATLALPTVIVQEGGYLLEHLGANAVAFLQAFARR